MLSFAQKKLIILTSTSIAVLCLFILIITLPLIRQTKDLSEAYLQGQETLFQLTKRDASIKELEESYQNNQKDLIRISGAFLGSEETVGFITDLEQTAEQTNNDIEIQIVDLPVTKQKDDSKSAISFRISLAGSFSGLIHYLANLENTPYPPYRLIEVESISVSQGGGRTVTESGDFVKTGGVRSVLDVKVYTQ